MERRTFISTLVAISFPGILIADAQDNVVYEFEVSESHAKLVSGILTTSHSKPLKSKAGVVILLIAGAASLVAIAEAILVLVHRAKLGHGVIVDARSGNIRVDPEPNLPPGMILVRQPDGQVTLETESSTEIGELIGVLLRK